MGDGVELEKVKKEKDLGVMMEENNQPTFVLPLSLGIDLFPVSRENSGNTGSSGHFYPLSDCGAGWCSHFTQLSVILLG
ncbi:hypothetical protein E2C01_061298 [Portunus trituberculatus]|uniref:Uncharacterized protein n=1 Tax=Portunus trituberculatus TaxID=210409 RepID=A0A5B7H7R0_PORTR|nr:hypothetical protein [Portunus trituberculatus]